MHSPAEYPLEFPPLNCKPKERKKKSVWSRQTFDVVIEDRKQQAAHSNLREAERECLLISPPLLATFVVVYIFDLE